MDYPRNPAPTKERTPDKRPSLADVYTPNFTIPGGASGLTLTEYRNAIWDHDPAARTCLGRYKYQLASSSILSAISGFYVAKHFGYRMPMKILTSGVTLIGGALFGSMILPYLNCSPEEINALHHVTDLTAYGPYKRDDGEEAIFKPKGLEMDDSKWLAKGLQPPGKR